MLAYVFWHWPMSATAGPSYETAMLDFHERLRDVGSPAPLGSRTFRVEGEPWLPDGRGYVDWYLPDEGFAALDVLNELAVSPSLKEAHDRPAHMVALGAGGVYRLIAGVGGGQPPGAAIWLSKPRSVSYPAFHDRLRRSTERGDVATWQRQLVLGPHSSSACSRRNRWTFRGNGVPSRRGGPWWVVMEG
ncbi:MAG TPA: hypothetical protein VKF14_18395 [Candidatus Dormibacteraeota bacterium]|nr:hypothetical protein [Candidatus Dormibacteraeota bacterium]